MQTVSDAKKLDIPLAVSMGILTFFSILMLRSISSFLFPVYYFYIVLGLLAFYLFSKIDFDILSYFSKHFYVFCIFILILPLLVGQITRGAVRWIPVGALTIQPAEVVRPFLLIFFANYITSQKFSYKKIIKSLILLSLPVLLILIQPSLGVAGLTIVAFLGVLLASGMNKKYIAMGILILIMLLPITWFLLAQYQKVRVLSFLDPKSDPFGAGYNSIQSMISIGSGKLLGRGLGKGVQTQLAFLPERHTDFIFASISEELGFVGATLVIFLSFFILLRLTLFMENSMNPQARAFIAGLFFSMFVQISINIGMNLGLLPITGLPLPLVSAGGSSLLATMISLGIAVGARKSFRA